MENSVILITGTTRSGISLLVQCLKILGLKPLNEQAQVGMPIIHNLLFQGLNHSSTMAGPLPAGWIQTPSADQARQRINALIANYQNTTGGFFLADPFLCRFMPLWIEAFHKAGLPFKMVFMVRHPWEAAQSLAAKENIDLLKAHLLWLQHIRDSLYSCQAHRQILITFDQLLADPVSALGLMGNELNLVWENDPCVTSSFLLDFVQPSLKSHHASNLPEKDKQKFRAYERLYQAIRVGQWSGAIGENLVNRNSIMGSEAFSKPVGSIHSRLRESVELDLVDSLLDAVGEYEKKSAGYHFQMEKIASNTNRSFFAQVVFPTSRGGGEIIETIPLITNGWQKISFSVPEPSLLRNKPIILKPLNSNGMVKVSAIYLINEVTKETMWSAGNYFDQLGIHGTAVKIPNRECLVLLITGDNPQIILPCLKEMHEFPLCIEFWMKAKREQSDIAKYFYPEQSKIKNEKFNHIQDCLNKILSDMMHTFSFHEKFTEQYDVFIRKSEETNKGSYLQKNTFWGSPIFLIPNEEVSKQIFCYSLYEPPMSLFFVDFILPGSIVIDIGAHIGYFSMLAAELVGGKGKVFSFEPTPATLEILNKNVVQYPQVHIIPKLVWSSETQMEFHDFGTELSAFNTAVSARIDPERKTKAEDNCIMVEATTIDLFSAEMQVRPDLIKIDAESAEMHVLQGMKSILDIDRPIITIEVGDMIDSNIDDVPTSRELLEFVMNFDYLPLESIGARYQEHELKTENYDYDNIVMVPRERLPFRRPLGTVAVQHGQFF